MFHEELLAFQDIKGLTHQIDDQYALEMPYNVYTLFLLI